MTPAWRVCAAFFLYAFAIGGFYPRLPEIQRALGVGERALGFALIGTACGTLLSLTFASRLLERVGHRRALLGLMALLPAFYAAASTAPGALSLFALLLPTGLCIGAIEIIVNLEADRVEHQSGRRFMNRAHGFWSVGFFAAGAVGASMSHWGVSPQMQLALTVPVQLTAIALLLGRFDPAPHREAGAQRAAAFAVPSCGVMALVALALSALLLEGAGIDWSAIYMRDVFAATPFTSGMAVAVGALAQALARFFADRLIEKHQPVVVARALLATLGAGTLLVFIAPHSALALLGFALMGVGTSAIFPLAMSAAAQRTDRPAAINVAALAQMSFTAFLLGPPLLGAVAQAAGIRWVFGAALPLVVVSWVAASALRSTPAGRSNAKQSQPKPRP